MIFNPQQVAWRASCLNRLNTQASITIPLNILLNLRP